MYICRTYAAEAIFTSLLLDHALEAIFVVLIGLFILNLVLHDIGI